MKQQENNENVTKKTRKKRSVRTVQQIKLAVIMIMVSVMILSASTFAWYQMSKTAKVENMQFTADTLGNLQISLSQDGEYSNSISLRLSEEGNTPKLLPATTADGKEFKKPDYGESGGTKVESVKKLQESGNDFSKYVYKQVFYIKSGTNVGSQEYNLVLVASNQERTVGTYIKDKISNDTKNGYTALNAVRVGFVFGDGATIPKNGHDVTIYEPSVSNNNSGGTLADKSAVSNEYGPAVYDETLSLKQSDNGTFTTERTLCTITEGKPVTVTMYVWLEGNDDDCANEIALDTILGQIQFEAKPTT